MKRNELEKVKAAARKLFKKEGEAVGWYGFKRQASQVMRAVTGAGLRRGEVEWVGDYFDHGFTVVEVVAVLLDDREANGDPN